MRYWVILEPTDPKLPWEVVIWCAAKGHDVGGSLTDRQMEVLELLAQGLSNRDIAEELVITVGTVKWHNRQIYNKLGVNNRTEAVTSAHELGLLQEGERKPQRRAELSASAGRPKQKLHFTDSFDGVRIAYAISGDGPPLVKAAHFLNHLQFDWQSPVWRHWMEAFSSEYTYIRYDERGTGLSDWDVENISLEAWVQDLAAVVDEVGLQRFPLMGASQGGPVAIRYAIEQPERVSHLILYGAYGRGRMAEGAADEESSSAHALLRMTESGWAQDNPGFRRMFATEFIPEASLEELRSFEHVMQLSASAENAARTMRAMAEIDVLEDAANLKLPTLVLHCRQDQAVSFERGRKLAGVIPGARFVPLESKNHILRSDEPAWSKFLREIRGFLSS
ncbi:MAG: alpha/beta fold hydrolase [Anaerolineales bacterium]|nr:alpha/beta fold hydrolase [Anaerolineales bacterium]